MNKTTDSPIYVIVDIETTGGRASRDEIIEVAILSVQDGKIIDEWSSLIRPHGSVPYFITQLTGIDNSMVEDAPEFHEVAREIVERTQGQIFVAHNAKFDYGFIKNAFRSLGFHWKPKHVLCSVKLARILYPKFSSHSMDSLVSNLSLKGSTRHRAMSDCVYVKALFDHAVLNLGQDAFDDAVNQVLKRQSLPSHLDMDVDDIPEKPGVYYFFGDGAEPIYIGKSINLRKRILSHFYSATKTEKGMKLNQQVRSISFEVMPGELSALIHEASEIKKHLPVHNRRLRRNKKLCSIKIDQNSEHHRPVIVNSIEGDNLSGCYGLFTTKRHALEKLNSLLAEHNVCLYQSGLENQKSCFNKQLGRCEAPCQSAAYTAEIHNLKLQVALHSIKEKTWPYEGAVAIEERDGDFVRYIIANNWELYGITDSVPKFEELLDKPLLGFDRDIYRILCKCLTKKSKVVRL